MDEWLDPNYKKRYEVNRMHIIKRISRRIERYIKKGPRPSIVTVNCDYCDKLIHKKPSQLKYYKNHFCNRLHHASYVKMKNKIPVDND